MGRVTTSARRAPRLGDGLIGASVVIIVALALVLSVPALEHWFVIPCVACGLVLAPTAAGYFRGRRSLLDPTGLVAAYGLYFFFLAPLLHIVLEWWMRYVAPPPDWRPWLGLVACLNFVGLLGYSAARRWADTEPTETPRRSGRLVPGRFWLLCAVGMLTSAGAHSWVISSYGGLSGFVASFEKAGDQFAGLGVIFIVSEAFPLIAFLSYVVASRSRPLLRHPILVAAALALFVCAKVLFGALRGSRGSVVYSLFWCLGMLHLRVRPFGRTAIIGGIMFLLGFMYIFGLYKSAGGQAFSDITDRGAIEDMEQRTGRSMTALLLGDLGRSDVQAYLAYRMWASGESYEYGLGSTYVEAFAFLVPRSLWNERPMGKVRAGTNALHGEGAFAFGRFMVSNAYGLAGEAMLNFGPLAVPVAYTLFGAVVGRLTRFMRRRRSASADDPLVLLEPLIPMLCTLALVWDLDNLLYFVVSIVLVPATVLLTSRRTGIARDPRS